MEVVKIACDNPSCKSVGAPEFYGGQIPKKGKWSPPYGWLLARNIGYFGSGPYIVKLVVCQSSCLQPAFDEAVRQVTET